MIAGLLDQWIGFLFVLVVVAASYFGKFEQLPAERLINRKLLALVSGDAEQETLKRIIMHRGGSIDTPENTIEAIREAARLGVAGVEVDLQFTGDGVGILLHDDMLDRTTDGTGDVRLMTYEQLGNLDAAAKHGSKSKYGYKVKIPTLEECLVECMKHNLLIFLDCKAFPLETVQLMERMLSRYPQLYETVVVCSFYPQIVYTMRKANRKVLTGLTYRAWFNSREGDCVTPRYTGFKHYGYVVLDFLYALATYGFLWFYCGNTFFLLNKESLSRNEVNWWRNLGVTVLPWTVNSKVEKQFCLDYLKVPIITDGLDVPE